MVTAHPHPGPNGLWRKVRVALVAVPVRAAAVRPGVRVAAVRAAVRPGVRVAAVRAAVRPGVRAVLPLRQILRKHQRLNLSTTAMGI